jgi:hypothetical protein
LEKSPPSAALTPSADVVIKNAVKPALGVRRLILTDSAMALSLLLPSSLLPRFMPPLSLSDPSIFASPHVFPPSSDPPLLLVLVLYISVDPLFSLSFDLDSLIATRVKNNSVAYIAQICRKAPNHHSRKIAARERHQHLAHSNTHQSRGAGRKAAYPDGVDEQHRRRPRDARVVAAAGAHDGSVPRQVRLRVLYEPCVEHQRGVSAEWVQATSSS